MPSPAPQAPPVLRIALLLGGLVSLTIIGSSAVAVALPQLSVELGLDTAGASWVLAGYGLTFSISTALFGRVADRTGLRLPLRVGVVLMAAGSLIGAFAGSFPMLVAGRLVQGAGSGAVPVLTVGVVTAAFPEQRRGAALASLTAVVAIVSGSGPLLGGAITQVGGWRLVLAVPVIGLLIAEPVARLAPVRRGTAKLDLTGAALVAITVSSLMLVLQAPSAGFGAPVVAGLLTSLVTGAALLRSRVRRRPHGFLPRAVVRNSPLVRNSLTAATLMAAYISSLFALPEIMWRTQGWPPLRIGVVMLPAALVAAAVSRISGRVPGHPRARLALAGAAGSAATGLVVAGTGWRSPFLLVVGFALVAIAFAVGQVIVIEAVPRLVEEGVRGVALGTFNVTFFGGSAVGAAVTGGLAGPLTLPGALIAVAVLPVVGAFLALSSSLESAPRT